MTERGDGPDGDSGTSVASPSAFSGPNRRRICGALRDAFRRRLEIDVRALAALRIALGVVLLVDLALRSRNLTAFYTDDGVLPRALLVESYPLARFSLYTLSGEAWAVAALFLLAAVAAVALVVGYRTRVAAVVSVILLASLQARNPFVLNAGDTLFWQLLGVGLLCPLGARWSVDAVLDDAEGSVTNRPDTHQFAGLRSALFLSVVLAVYVSNAVVKLRGEAWPAGEAVGTVFQLTYLHGPLGGLVPESPALLTAATYGWLGLLVASPLLVAAAGWIRATLAGVLLAAHLSLALVLQIGIFPLVSASALIVCFPASVWDRIEEATAPAINRCRSAAESRFSPPAVNSAAPGPDLHIVPDRATRGRALDVVAGVLLVVLLAWTAMGLGVVDAPEPLAAVSDPAESDWDMFAPAPPSTDALVVATATTVDGDRVDALYGDAVARDRPPSDARRSPTARWRKHISLLSASDSERTDATLASLCDRATGFSGSETTAVTLAVIEVDPVEDRVVDRRELGARRCR